MGLTRRQFISHMVSLGFSAATAGALFSLLACSSETTLLPAPATTPSQPPSLLSPPTTSSSPSAAPAPTVGHLSPTPSSTPSTLSPAIPGGAAYLAVARGESPAALVQSALKALGGIERFVKKGADVIVKPNICVAYHSYEYAATTNPDVVGAIVKLCLSAGAKRVRVMDQPFGGTPQEAYSRSGIAEAVSIAGGTMEVMSNMKFREVPIPGGKDIAKWQVYGDVLDADVLINVPIAKHHNLGRLTLGMKNLMGIIKDRSQFHSNLGQRVADLASVVKPALTIVDAMRILVNHGPTGGNLNDVKLTNTIIASHDIVSADAYAATLFGLTGSDIPAIRSGAQMGLGVMDLSTVKIEEIRA